MHLKEIMEAMGETGQCVGNVEFETLALADTLIEGRKLTFIDDIKYMNDSLTDSDIVLTTKEIANASQLASYCICESPRVLYFKIHNYLAQNKDYKRNDFETQIGKGCIISPLSSIASKNVIIGNNVRIEEFVVIRENSVINDNSIIRAGAKIGSEGFEFKRFNNEIISVVHLGGVIIGKNVEIQYNTCVDKAVYPWDNTEIGNFTKIDNLVHIGHAAKIGKCVMIVANCGIGGCTAIGDNCWIGFGATITNSISVGHNSRANIGSVVTKKIPDQGNVTGNFAIDHQQFIQNLKSILQNN